MCGPQGRDGYDDSIAVLLALEDSARLLSGALAETYVARHYPGGAIDHLLVAGAVFIVPATLACLWVLNDPQRFHRSKPAQPMALLAFLLYSAGAGTGLLVV